MAEARKMEDVVGDAVFKSFPGEGFRFGVGRTSGAGKIWLESQVSKKRWECDVTDITEFAPADVVLPQETVLHYVAASLRESAGSSESSSMGPDLVRKESEEALQLEVLVKLGVPDFAWAPKYVFPMTLVAQEPPPSDPQSPDRLDRLTTQVQELQQEVKTLKAQMQAVLRSRAPSQPTAEPSSPSSTSGSSPSASLGHSPAPSPASNPTENGNEAATVTPSRKDQVWGDIIGHPQHQLLQTADYRETRNSFGVMVRKHRQRSCKVCSVLRGDRKRAFETSYYCVECTERHKGAIVFLCDKVRPHDADEYRNATCSQIWHVMWNNGADIPHGGISSIRMRKKLKTGDVGGGDANAFPADMARPSRDASR